VRQVWGRTKDVGKRGLEGKNYSKCALRGRGRAKIFPDVWEKKVKQKAKQPQQRVKGSYFQKPIKSVVELKRVGSRARRGKAIGSEPRVEVKTHE